VDGFLLVGVTEGDSPGNGLVDMAGDLDVALGEGLLWVAVDVVLEVVEG
jgi:hypothetical protein